MKIHFEVDCTPEEARAFCGLPDLQPLHQAVLAKMEAQMLAAVDAGAPENILKNWLSLAPQNAEQLWNMFGKLFASPTPRDRS